MPGKNTNAWKALLGVELGTRVRILETPPGFGVASDVVYQVQHLEVAVVNDIASSSFTFQLWPASVTKWLILDDAVYGRLDSGNLLAY
jgi:hypothetical protein